MLERSDDHGVEPVLDQGTGSLVWNLYGEDSVGPGQPGGSAEARVVKRAGDGWPNDFERVFPEPYCTLVRGLRGAGAGLASGDSGERCAGADLFVDPLGEGLCDVGPGASCIGSAAGEQVNDVTVGRVVAEVVTVGLNDGECALRVRATPDPRGPGMVSRKV